MNKVNSVSSIHQSELLTHCEAQMIALVSHDQPALFHLKSGGSRTRAKICINAGVHLNLEPHDIINLACTVELLHNASLIHDDVQDNDIQRRGRPSVWKKFGKSSAICSGDAMLSGAYSALADISNPNLIGKLLLETHKSVSETITGQSRDLCSSDASTVAEYESIAAMKSGPLFRLGLMLPIILAEQTKYKSKIYYITSKFATAYQINDDLYDWQQDKACGQLNLVNILASQSNNHDALIMAKDRARYLLKQCQKELALLPDNCASLVSQHTDILLDELESSY